jgi:pentatricopeptide repeat protein
MWAMFLYICMKNVSVEDAHQMFDEIPVRNTFSWNTMVRKYAKSGRILDAHQLFDIMCERNIVSWNAMIIGYSQHGSGKEALLLFCQMQTAGEKPN